MGKILQSRMEGITNNTVMLHFIKVYALSGERNMNIDTILIIMGFQHSLYEESICGH